MLWSNAGIKSIWRTLMA
ncbi:mCG1050989 [Mus musculus]|nr:mCG1050989 [Mus musculus]